MIHFKQQNGFIVLTTVIILSVVLLLLAQSLSSSGYFERQGMLQFEFKELSYFVALSCMDRAIANLFQDFEYGGDEIFTIDAYSCYVYPMTYLGADTIVQTSATVESSTTRLKSILDADFN